MEMADMEEAVVTAAVDLMEAAREVQEVQEEGTEAAVGLEVVVVLEAVADIAEEEAMAALMEDLVESRLEEAVEVERATVAPPGEVTALMEVLVESLLEEVAEERVALEAEPHLEVAAVLAVAAASEAVATVERPRTSRVVVEVETVGAD